VSDVLEDWESARHGTRWFAESVGPGSDSVATAVAAANALAAELLDLRARAGQCRACRTMGGPDVRCDACSDSGMVAEVARLREEHNETLAALHLANHERVIEARKTARRAALSDFGLTLSTMTEASSGRRRSERAVIMDCARAAIRALAGDKP